MNLTVANQVYLMDPWWQEGIENQAIDRCNRIGQKKPVTVFQLIAEDTVEERVSLPRAYLLIDDNSVNI